MHCFSRGVALAAPLFVTFLSATANADPNVLFVAGGYGSTVDAPGGELSLYVGDSRVMAGAQLQASRLDSFVIQGRVRANGRRLRARLPLALQLNQNSDIRLDLLVAPGLRSVAAGGVDAFALTADAGLQASFRLHSRFTGHTAFVFPFALDIRPATEVSRFPGVTVCLGATFALTERLGLTSRLAVSMAEGSNGDGEKSIVEGQLLFHVRFGDSSKSIPMIPPALGGSI
jgi:hypothetical protein